ncbi:MAG TPA: hypothetical protein DCF33_15430 [Saprospirales bacterium]|nr:hypothetical protein [Saprospirales bacterium]
MENHKEIPDLEHLKAAWNHELEQQAEAAPYINQQNLLTMMHQRTHSTLARLKRNLLIEIISTAFMLAAVYGYTLWTDQHISPLIWLLIVLVTFSGHVALFISLYQQDQRSALDVKEALDISVLHTGKFVRLGKQTAWVASAIVLFAGIQWLLQQEMSFRPALVQGIYSVLAAIGVYTLIHFYIEKLYGQYYKQLLKHQEELLE